MIDIRQEFKKYSYSEKIFYISILITCFLGFYLICFGHIAAIYSVIVSLITFANLYVILYLGTKPNWLYKEIATYVMFLVLISHLPVFFYGSARINRSRRTRDDLLESADTALFGWLWEKGQISITLDHSPNFNPETNSHKVFASILQVFYFIYYIYPYGCIYFMPLVQCIIGTVKKYKQKGNEPEGYKKKWNDLYFITAVYIISYTLCNILNTTIPAVSPRLYFTYTHKLKLYGIAEWINNTFKDDNSANSFPSGHVSETMCIAFALFGMRRWIVGSIVLFGCIMILLATLILRYHYMIDVIAALLSSTFSFLVPYLFYRKDRIEKELYTKTIEDLLTTNDKIGMELEKEEKISELSISFHPIQGNNDSLNHKV